LKKVNLRFLGRGRVKRRKIQNVLFIFITHDTSGSCRTCLPW